MKKLFCFLLIITSTQVSILFSQIWTEQVSGVGGPLNCVSVIDNNNAWICGGNASVIKTTNSGTNWIYVGGNGIAYNYMLVNIFGIDANTALVTGYITIQASIFKTTNGGANWVSVFFQPEGGINAIWMTSSTQGFMVGNPVGGRWSIWKTTDAGSTWDSTGMYLPRNTVYEIGYINSFCYSNSRIWFGTNNYRIYYSSNNGMNWIFRTTPEQNSYVVYFNGTSTGLMGGNNLWESDDTGVTWTSLNSLGSGAFGAFTFYPIPVDNLSAQSKYIRNDNKIYYSPDGAQGWTIEYTAPSGTYTHMAEARNGSYITFAVRDNAGISRCTCPIYGIEKISSKIPEKFDLKQNYPNPFNPSTKIEFDIPKESFATMKIYDITGKLVDILLDESLKPGTYVVTFDGSNIASGIYFYSLQTSEFTKTNKMIILK